MPGLNTSKSMSETISKRVDSLLLQMSLREKVGQMNQYNGFWDVTGPLPSEGESVKKYKDLKDGLVGSMLNVTGVPEVMRLQKIAVEESRLGIPLIIGYDVIHGFKTLSPIPLAESASWDVDMIRKSAEVAATEAAACGINWTFAPMVDVSRDPRWGRVMEGAGEDPFLGSKIAIARIRGFQGEELSSINTIAACAKHFAGSGFSEAGKEYNTTDISESLLHNVVFPPFKAAVKAGVKTFMNGFNELNGIPTTGNAFLQRTILKENWGFKGFVVSDWCSIGEMIPHGYAKDKSAASNSAIQAGSDMDMESYCYIDNLEKLVLSGKVDEALINDAVKRILTVKFELGLFDNPYKYCDITREKKVVGNKVITETVLEMAKKSIVLLKNEGHLLPLRKKGLNIAVIGALAKDKDSPLGSWRAKATENSAVSVLEGLSAYKGNNVTYAKGISLIKGSATFVSELEINTTDRSGIKEAVSIAKNKDIVLMVLGEHAFQTGEGRSRTSLDLPGLQQELLEEVYKVNKNIVLVLMNGRPLTINWADQQIPAILEVWHLGSQSGNAIAQVLYGDYNPSGKLPITFPKSVGQIPVYYNHKNTGRPTKPSNDLVFWSHYSDQDNTPLYPFGYGLSYTSFKYDQLKLSRDAFTKRESIKVSVRLTNTGNYKGTEVVQMYIRDIFASITRPVKELKGFQLVSLNPGMSKQIEFTIDEELISFYTANQKWEAETGDFELMIGGDSVKTVSILFSFID
ncbi:MAG: beta-glucosidase BglX [Flavobacteriaceae bacterium]|nr:MAG: beta-glucosidase BglX [Flavobacteriaceae bacterium]